MINKYRSLGRTGIKVSPLSLGTMTFGEQNTKAEGHAQLDLALDHGVNLIDTAEQYPVPPRAETYGETEAIIGDWLARPGNRERVVLATKVAGPTTGLPTTKHIRGGLSRLDRANITDALDQSLKRLRTDYIDLYQLHWPDRATNFFGKLGYEHPAKDESTPILETLEVLGDLVKTGKIRSFGVSNETPWGLSKYIHLAETKKLPRVASIQNPYSLLNRTYEIGLVEISIREEVGLLAYSPLAFGVLSGKYLDGTASPNSRLKLYPQFSRYNHEHSQTATKAYVALAKKHGISPSQLALAYALSKPFITSVIVGATTLNQLKENLLSADLALSPEIIAEIEAIHNHHPNPAP